MLTRMAVRSTLVALPAFGLAIGFALPLMGQAAWQGSTTVWAARGSGSRLRLGCRMLTTINSACEMSPPLSSGCRRSRARH